MITVSFQSDEKSKSLSLTIKGHAGQADIGQDIICSSASILAYTAAQIVKSMADGGDLKGTPTISLENGDAEIACKCRTKALYAEADYAFQVVLVGYSLLAHNYPQYVEIKEVG